MKKRWQVFAVAMTIAVLSAAASQADVIYLTNGDIIHGDLVSANNTSVTLQTKYGKLEIPKEDIKSIGDPAAASADAETEGASDTASAETGERPEIALHISGRSFWYAFQSPADNSIRLRFSVGDDYACTYLDDKPDTVDGETVYNSFTFSPTDSRLSETAEGFVCSVEKAEDGAVALVLELPPGIDAGQHLVRMIYEINVGSRGAPRWQDIISRSFSIDLAAGKRAVVQLEQDATALDYSGTFKKSMKNVEQFQVYLRSAELRD